MDNSNSMLWGAIAVGAVTLAYVWWRSTSDRGDGGQNEEKQEEQEVPKFERLPVGKLTVDEIAKYRGENGSRILCSICGRIFDMTSGRDFYGADGPYSCFTGGDASFMLGAMSLNQADRNKTDFEVDGDHQMTLGDWIGTFRRKYPIVGRLEGFEKLCPESWAEAGPEDDNVSENANIFGDPSNSKIDKLSLTDLAGCGNDWVSVGGFVFNVKGAEFVYAPFYGDFPGAIRHDISVALGLNEFKPETYNQSLGVLNDNRDARSRLVRAFNAFCQTYPIVGKITDDGYTFDLSSNEWQITDPPKENASGNDNPKL